jgi:hypothetical protein
MSRKRLCGPITNSEVSKMDFSFAEHTKVIPVQAPVAITSAAMTTEYVNAQHAQKLTWFLYLGALSASHDSATISVRVGDDASGTHNTNSNSSMDFVLADMWQTGVTAAASCDMLTKQTISTTGSIDSVAIASSDDGTMFVVELSCAKLGTFVSTAVTYNADFVALEVASAGASGAGLVSLMCIASGLRYKQASPPTAIA